MFRHTCVHGPALKAARRTSSLIDQGTFAKIGEALALDVSGHDPEWRGRGAELIETSQWSLPVLSHSGSGPALKGNGEARRVLCDAAIKMQSWSLTKAGAETVIGNIDEMAFLLTGHRKFYQAKPHSTSWTTPAMPPPNDPE
jgi:hypothetical protein